MNKKKRDRLLEQVKDFYESLADRWSVSASFGDSTLVNFLFVYELKDAQQAKTYMDEVFLEKAQLHRCFRRSIYNAQRG